MTSESAVIRIPVPVQPGQLFTCSACSRSSCHRYNFGKHVKEQHQDVSIVYVCRQCNLPMTNYRSVRFHRCNGSLSPPNGTTPGKHEDSVESVEPVATSAFSASPSPSPSPVNTCSSTSTSTPTVRPPWKTPILVSVEFKLAAKEMSMLLDLDVHHDDPFECVLEEKEGTSPKVISIVETPTHIEINTYRSETDEINTEEWASNDTTLVVYAFKFKCISLFRDICV